MPTNRLKQFPNFLSRTSIRYYSQSHLVEKNNLANTADLKLQSSLHQAFQEDSGKSKLLAYLL